MLIPRATMITSLNITWVKPKEFLLVTPDLLGPLTFARLLSFNSTTTNLITMISLGHRGPISLGIVVSGCTSHNPMQIIIMISLKTVECNRILALVHIALCALLSICLTYYEGYSSQNLVFPHFYYCAVVRSDLIVEILNRLQACSKLLYLFFLCFFNNFQGGS